MKKALLFLTLILSIAIHAQTKITLEDLWVKASFRMAYPEGYNAMNNGLHYTDLEKNGNLFDLVKYEIKTGKKVEVLVKGEDVKINGSTAINLEGYKFSPDESKIILSKESEHIYRRSSKSNNYIFDIATKKLSDLSANGKQMFPTFSQDSKKVAFVRDNNLFYKNLETNEEIQVTTDGANNKIKNGWADWVYEEEFSKANYFEWSADGKYLAFVRWDESNVKEYSMDLYNGNLYPDDVTFKYPKAGEDNSVMSVHIYDAASKKTISADIGTEKDIYIPRITWASNTNLYIQRMNRLQNKIELLFANAGDGKSKVILTEEAKTYIDITDNLTFLEGNKGFIWSSEMDEFNHLYYYDINGKLVNQITKGNWDVIEFKGFDEKTSTLFYTSTERGAINRDLYSINLKGSAKKLLSTAEGTTDADFTKGYKYYVSSYSNANTPGIFELHTADGKLVKVLEDNKALVDKLKPYNLSQKTFFTFKTTEGVELNGWMIKPANFDANKKYPVYMTAYNGPGSNMVNNSWTSSLWEQLLAQEGYMVVCVDGRGTLGRGRQFKHCTYLQLGKLETIDQIEVAKYLGTLPYVDKSRICFQGWSYGGYMASLLISKGADYFKAAIAVAPVTNWKYYDNIYTERFLRKPADNKSGYEDNSPVNFVKQIKGKFLLVHGAADDNVHYQNSMEMAKALVMYNIPFEFMTYPNKNHGIYGGNTRLHLYTKILNFVKQNL